MPSRSKSPQGKIPHCPICDTDMTVARYEGFHGRFLFWSCDCSDEALQGYGTELAAPTPVTSLWSDDDWDHYYKCQECRNIEILAESDDVYVPQKFRPGQGRPGKRFHREPRADDVVLLSEPFRKEEEITLKLPQDIDAELQVPAIMRMGQGRLPIE